MNAQTENIGEHLDLTRCRKPCITGDFMMNILEKIYIIKIFKIRSMRLAGRLVSYVRNLRNLSALVNDSFVY